MNKKSSEEGIKTSMCPLATGGSFSMNWWWLHNYVT